MLNAVNAQLFPILLAAMLLHQFLSAPCKRKPVGCRLSWGTHQVAFLFKPVPGFPQSHRHISLPCSVFRFVTRQGAQTDVSALHHGEEILAVYTASVLV